MTSCHSDCVIPNDNLWVVWVLCQIANHQYHPHQDPVCPARDCVGPESLMIVSAINVYRWGCLLVGEDRVMEELNLIPAQRQTGQYPVNV